MKVKYLERRQRAGNRVVWVVNPPKVVKDAVPGACYEQFATRSEAVERAMQVADAFQDYKKGLKTTVHIPQDTVEGLFSFYKTTNHYLKLKDNSKRFYQLMMKQASSVQLKGSNIPFGEVKCRNVDPTQADKLYMYLRDNFTHHKANSVMKVMRRVWFIGLRHGRVQFNPFQKMGIEGVDDRTILWTPEQVSIFMDKADQMGFPSIGTLALLCYDLCQRPGDMRQLTWDSYNDGYFEFKQEKTGTIVSMPASPRLIERLKRHAGNTEFIVECESTRTAYDRRLYNKYAARVRNQAGLPAHLQLRDLRRTGATEMAEAGCTEDELRSVTGHQSRDVLSIYVRPTTRLAASGINKRFASP